ncbi:hypothetical protein ATY41_07120 [Leifsonia xyli subsp. xyli]|uniref:Uncharacterized protein n=1 Tax=Leifsonia xyli subsp. xyli TaxID=59736 RepID=A0A1E2SMD3_LEIXY|nr:hypothetical protein ATY41_07120 [Leifsonia xyli subsp. xyli]
MRKPAYSAGAPASGQITIASCPRAASSSNTRRTLVVTPFTVGRKLSLTMATRMPPVCAAQVSCP